MQIFSRHKVVTFAGIIKTRYDLPFGISLPLIKSACVPLPGGTRAELARSVIAALALGGTSL
jgi:hypothetical protein